MEYVKTKRFEDLGKMHLEDIKRVPLTMWEKEINENIISIPNIEFKNVSVPTPNTIISGLLPGSCKTHTAIKLGERSKTVVLVATNEQVERIKKEYGVESYTMCHALGYVINGSSLERKSSPNLEKWGMVIVDEIFQQNIKLLGRLREYMKTSKSVFYATGDEFQTNIPEEVNNIKNRNIYLKILCDMFPTRYWIESSKRILEKDIPTLVSIKNDLFVEGLKPKDIIKKYGLNIIDNWSKVPIRNLSLSNLTSHLVNMKMHLVWGLEEVVCKVHHKDLVVNRTYKVEKSLKGYYVINGKEYKKSLFRYSYCSTIHSSQGSTIEGSYCVFDIDSVHSSAEVFWVALTRCRKLSDVMFWMSSREEIGGMSQEVYSELKKNNYCCLVCNEMINMEKSVKCCEY
jgi:hypothetical protein